MPWASSSKSKNAVRGCFGSAGKNPKKRAKCRKLAHEAKVWRKGRMLKRHSVKRVRKAIKR